MKHLPISYEEMNELLNYDPYTGKMTWKKSRRGCSAGKEAGTISRRGYRRITVNRKRYFVSRIAWVLYHKKDIKDLQIDHVNHDRGDNRIENLRPATNKMNGRNRTKHKNNTSGLTGVVYRKRTNNYEAMIRVDGVQKYLGMFDCKYKAYQVRRLAEIEYGFHRNHGIG